MDPLSITGTLIAVLQISGAVISTLYEYRSAVKSASKDAARIIGELNSLRSVLESLLQAVEAEEELNGEEGKFPTSHLNPKPSRLATFQALTQSPTADLPRCVADLEDLHSKIFISDDEKSRWKRARQALIWPLKEKEVDRLVSAVQRAKSTMQLALATDQAVLALAIHDGVRALTQKAADDDMDRRRARVREWLGDSAAWEERHVAARKNWQLGTGEWFLGGKQYEVWQGERRSICWLYGIPGAGKSVLCSSIIEDLSLRCQEEDSWVMAYYYFYFNDAGGRDVNSLIRALLTQILAKIPPDSKSLEEFSSEIDNEQRNVPFLLQKLKKFVSQFDHVYIVIDALDECSECEDLMNVIAEIHGWNQDRLHILVAGRQLREIEETMQEISTVSICLQNSKINPDISILIRKRLDTDKKLKKWPEAVREEIEQALTKGASGMFRWVVCQLDMLRNCVTLNALRNSLNSLPKTLDDTYERILANIDESYAGDVKKILMCLNFAVTPLSITKIVEILAIDWDRDEPCFELENRLPDPKDIFTMCSTLITSSKISSEFPSYDTVITGDPLQLAHFSVQEYLVSERIKTSKASMYSMDFITGNLFIAKSLLIYLLNPQLLPSSHDGYTEDVPLTLYPLLSAAAYTWPVHVEAVGDALDPDTKQLIQRLFATRHLPFGGNYAIWVSILIPEAEPETIMYTPPLYYAASFGLILIVEMLLADMPRSEIDNKGGRAMATPLHVAIFRRQEECVKLLLEAGADPNTSNSRGESCLYWARRKEFTSKRVIYKMLVQHGAVDALVLKERKKEKDQKPKLVEDGKVGGG